MATSDGQTLQFRNAWLRVRDWFTKLPLPIQALLGFGVVVLGGVVVVLATGNGQRNGKSPFVGADTPAVPDSILYAHSTKRTLSQFLHPEMPDTLPPFEFDAEMFKALYEQANYLRRPDVKKFPVTGIGKNEMLETVERLQALQLADPHTLLSTFDFYRIQTDLKSDKVRITGYYTPLIKASRKREGAFQFPMYSKPKNNIPPPAAIWSGALAGRGLELAWVQSKKEVMNAQLQGSCLIEFPDGQRQFLGHGGSVRGGTSSYVFFTEVDDVVLGAGFFPVTARYTLAVDTKYIPLGACVLAELPEIDKAGNQIGTTYRILFAQDRGGAIKSTKRVDLYSGIGRKGLEEARRINRFARLWLILPKKMKNQSPS